MALEILENFFDTMAIVRSNNTPHASESILRHKILNRLRAGPIPCRIPQRRTCYEAFHGGGLQGLHPHDHSQSISLLVQLNGKMD